MSVSPPSDAHGGPLISFNPDDHIHETADGASPYHPDARREKPAAMGGHTANVVTDELAAGTPPPPSSSTPPPAGSTPPPSSSGDWKATGWRVAQVAAVLVGLGLVTFAALALAGEVSGYKLHTPTPDLAHGAVTACVGVGVGVGAGTIVFGVGAGGVALGKGAVNFYRKYRPKTAEDAPKTVSDRPPRPTQTMGMSDAQLLRLTRERDKLVRELTAKAFADITAEANVARQRLGLEPYDPSVTSRAGDADAVDGQVIDSELNANLDEKHKAFLKNREAKAKNAEEETKSAGNVAPGDELHNQEDDEVHDAEGDGQLFVRSEIDPATDEITFNSPSAPPPELEYDFDSSDKIKEDQKPKS